MPTEGEGEEAKETGAKEGTEGVEKSEGQEKKEETKAEDKHTENG